LQSQATIQQRNRLVLLCKNMDRWPEALKHSDRCLADLTPEDPDDLAARIAINRGSVLYDLGERSKAAEFFREALRRSRDGPPLEFAAAANNVGIFHLYHDELDLAEAILRQGLGKIENHPVAPAYLQTNLGLVLLTRALIDPGLIEEAEQLFCDVVRRFTQAGHLQGISYAISNRGICALARGRTGEAQHSFAETIRLAGKIGERWSAYGALANLAAIELLKPRPNPQEALRLAVEARDRARENNDPKGIADASLIAARAVLDSVGAAAEGSALLDSAEQMLTEAGEVFQRLGQRLGEAQSAFGLMELLNCRNDRGALMMERRGRELLAHTAANAMPSRLKP
ncbi:MAG: tetratricopeptide repeat protein, partial [Gammaproteobacteria bacterium]